MSCPLFDATPLGWWGCALGSQGSACGATLVYRTMPRWGGVLLHESRRCPVGAWLATVDDTGVQEAIADFNVDLGLLQSEFNAIPVRAPAAHDVRYTMRPKPIPMT